MIAALAGRRIDAGNAPQPRFPARNVAAVAERIRLSLQHLRVTTLVCSAARGADLLALETAGELGLRRHVLLPTSQEDFRRSSVVDGPPKSPDQRASQPDWGDIYDRVLQEVANRGGLRVVAGNETGQQSYLATNLAILDEAQRLGGQSHEEVIAILVWNLASRGAGDVTAAFREEALRRGLALEEISTL